MNNGLTQLQYAEDEIDLRELFQTIFKNKKFIIIFTSIITILSIVYVLLKTPIYEAKAIIKMGEYKLDNNANSIVLDESSKLSQELNILFIDILENEKNRISWIENISTLKKEKAFLSLSSHAVSNELAIEELNKVVKYIQNKHQKILNDIKFKRETNIKNLNKKIDKIKNRELPIISKKINMYKNDIVIYEKNLEKLLSHFDEIKNKTPSLAMLELNEQRHLTEMIFKLRQDLIIAEDKKFTLENETLETLKEDIEYIEILLKPYNYRNSEVVGKIMTNEYSVKPKKKLIVVVAFVTGLILSIFLVFFIEFIRNSKKDDESIN
ncbi:MAG: Wzz/FepE/Etk N-terminal domain-containing protein [Campylobacterota bacterium]|nr:Wzz/FepE/Etk N-terminal domain-containing protein [Campylobacterota bacterium]